MLLKTIFSAFVTYTLLTLSLNASADSGVRYDLSAVATVKLAWADTNDSWDNFGTGTNADHSYTDKYSFQYAGYISAPSPGVKTLGKF